MKRIITVKVARCLACKSCELACAVEHSSSRALNALAASDERPGYRVSIESFGTKAVPIHCNQCDDAPCLMVCPTGALSRKGNEDPIAVEQERCIGCKMCVQACPFGVISVRADGKGLLKCDLCVERLAAGKHPACVSACPTGALQFQEQEALNKAKRQKAAVQLANAQDQDEKEIGNSTWLQ